MKLFPFCPTRCFQEDNAICYLARQRELNPDASRTLNQPHVVQMRNWDGA